MANTKDHIGIRNGNLFCFHCGESQQLPLPMPVALSVEWMKGFARIHKSCQKIWTEPVNEVDKKTETQNAEWWAINGEHGMSSQTIFNHLSKTLGIRPLENRYPCTPSDPDDFKRCYKLIQAVPQWRSRLKELKEISPVWSNLVDNWDKLELMMIEALELWKNRKGATKMYEYMKELGC